MIHVVGLWENGWNTPIKEMDLWEYPLKEYNVAGFSMSPVSGILNGYVTEAQEVGDLIAARRAAGDTVVFVDENGEAALGDFVHPENACYVFGRSTTSLLIGYKQSGDVSVRISTPANQGGFWAHQAACLVLHDRYTKSV